MRRPAGVSVVYRRPPARPVEEPVTRRPPEPDPEQPEVPAAPADVPPGTAPQVRSEPGTSETLAPVQGVRAPDPEDDPA